MKLSHRGYFVVVIFACIFALTACKQEGPAEKAGEKVDQTVEKAGDKIDQSAKEASEKIDQTAEKAEQKMDAAGEAVKEEVKQAGEAMDDTAITAKIKAELVRDKELPASQIRVETMQNVVQLSGFVDSAAQKSKAAQVARSVQGVKDVKNDIIVR